jgi:glycosyltransferase involved in cell wall biosynthesis
LTVQIEEKPENSKKEQLFEDAKVIQPKPEAELGTLAHSKVIVGIPCYNEEKTIAKIVVQLRGVADKIIVCDDGSSDMTSDIASALGCKVIVHSRNEGKGAALRSLFKEAREERLDVFVTIDGDGQHEPIDLPKLIKPIIQGECDITIGSRYLDETSEMPGYRRFGSNVINSFVHKTSQVKAADTQSGYRAYSRRALMQITPGEDGMAVDAEILALASSLGLRTKEVGTKINYDGLETSTQNPISHSMQVIAGSLKFASLKHPLIFYGIPCIGFFLVSLIMGVYSGVTYASAGRLPFGPSLVAVSSFIVSAVLGAVAVILFSLTTVIKQNI